MGPLTAILFLLAQTLAGPPPMPHQPAGGDFNVKVQLLFPSHRQPVPFDYVDNKIMIEGDIGGQQGWLLIDTGGSHSVVDSGLAKQLGLKTMVMNGDLIGTSRHRIPKLFVADVPLVIPNHFSVRMPMFGIDLQPLSRSSRRRVIGVIGDDLISNLLLVVMKPTASLILLPATSLAVGCNGCPEPPRPIALTRIDTPTGAKEQLAATVDGRPLRLTLDTGFTAGLGLTPEAWARVKPAGASLAVRPSLGAGGVVDQVGASRLPRIMLGTIEVRDVGVEVQPWDPSVGDGVLGMGVLSRFSFSIDTKSGQMWLIQDGAGAPAVHGLDSSQPH